MAATLRTAIHQELLFSIETTETHIRQLRADVERRLDALTPANPDIAAVVRLVVDLAVAKDRLLYEQLRLTFPGR
jgi:hypothetical protein